MNYTWSILSMQTLNTPSPDFVVEVEWLVTATDGAYSASMKGVSRFTEEGSSFTPYASLTEQQVIDWVKDDLGEAGIENCESNLQGQIDTQKAPPTNPQNAPLPWSA